MTRPKLLWWHGLLSAAAILIAVLLAGSLAVTSQRSLASPPIPSWPVPTVGLSYYAALASRAPHDALTTASPTPTPSLLSVGVSPRNALPADTLLLTYTVSSPITQDVSLGAGLEVSLCSNSFFYEPSLDVTVTVPSGVSTVSRNLVLPNTSGVSYDVTWGLWSAGFGQEYSQTVQFHAVSVTGPTATPAVPDLQDSSLAPNPAQVGSTIVLTYTIYSPDSREVGLGADMAPDGSGQFIADPPHDRVVSLVGGTNVVTRTFDLASRSPGPYTVRWGVWNASFTTSYDLSIKPSSLVIWQPPGPSPTPLNTPTSTPTPGRCDTPVPPNTSTPTPSSTSTPTSTPTTSATSSPVPTNAPTDTPTDTATNTPPDTETPSPVPTGTPTFTHTPTETPTDTATYTGTPLPTDTGTPSPLPSDTETLTPTYTPTAADTGTTTPSPVSSDTPTNTATNTPSETATDTPTSTPAFTGTPTSTPASTNSLVGHVTWQGISQPSSRNTGITATLTLCESGTPVTYTVGTDISGYFTITDGLPGPGTYSYRIKGGRWLANSGNLSLGAGTSNVEFGMERTGDANNNNVVNTQDFTILKSAFGAYDARADFNNDGTVSVTDFTLMKSNFGQLGGAFSCP